MLSSIHPLGERAKRNRWPLTVSAFVTGCAAGGSCIGALAGTVGWGLSQVLQPSAAVEAALLIAVVVAAPVLDLGLFGLRVPTIRRQVDENWLNQFRGWVYGFGYGFQLGLGVVTVVTTAAVYATVAIALLTGSPVAGALVGGVFGLLRGLALIPGGVITTTERLHSMHRKLDRIQRPTARLAWFVEGVVAVVVISVLIGR